MIKQISNTVIVSRDNDAFGFLCCQIAKHIHDLAAIPMIQVSRRLVGEDDGRVDVMGREGGGERGAVLRLAFARARRGEKRDRETGLLTRQA